MSKELIGYVNAAAQGDTDAMAKLFSKTLKSSYYLALKLSCNADEAVEITQNAYARVFCTISRLKKPDAFEIFMRQNIAAVYKEGHKFTFGDASADSREDSLEFLSEDVYQNPQKAAAALGAVASLSPEMRSAIVLHYYSGMPIAPLAKYFNVSESTVNTVLEKAKAIIRTKCSSSEPAAIPGALPVLNRVFRDEAEGVRIDSSCVRAMFEYIFDKYQTFLLMADKQPVAAGAAAGGAYFNKSAASSEPQIPPRAEKSDDGLSDDIKDIDFDRFVDEPVQEAHSQKPKFSMNSIVDFFKNINLKNLDYKKVAIIAAVVVFIIIVIIVAAKAGGNSSSTGTNGGTVAADADTGSKWVPGGFDKVSEISYINENFCCFKSVTTGKYGLLDYAGNILIQPIYDSPFRACGTGRDYSDSAYTNSGKYHVVATVDNVDYYVTYSDGKAVVTGQKHESHSFDSEALPADAKYEERDRYFGDYAAAEKNGKWGYIDKDGKKVIPYQYEAVNFTTDTGSLGTLNKYNCDYCRPVTDGLVAVKNSDGYMGIVNLDNDTIAAFEYSMILPGKNGVYIAQKSGTWGVILTGNAINTFTSINLIIDTSDDVTTDEGGTDTYYLITGDGGINVRQDADQEAEKIGEIATGEKVKGLGTKLDSYGKEWLRIQYNGVYGYISMRLVQEETTTTITG